jgi:hypothetical protein
MPVTGTVGALTYTKAAIGDSPVIEYWIVGLNAGSGPFVDFIFDTTEQTFTILGAPTGKAILTRIEGDVNPRVAISKDIQPNVTSNVTALNATNASIMKFANSITSIDTIFTGISSAQYIFSAPVLTFDTGVVAYANANTCDSSLDKIQWPFYRFLATTNFQYNVQNQSIMQHSDGNVFIGGIEWAPISPYTNSSPRGAFASLKQYDNTVSALQSYALYETAGTQANNLSVFYNTYFPSIQESSDGNLVIYYSFSDSTSTTQLYFAKINKTPVSIQLQNIWRQQYRSNAVPAANANLRASSMKLDSSDNIFATSFTNNNSVVLKLDNNGNLQWSKQIANMRLSDSYLKTDNAFIVTGKTSTGNLWIAEYDNTGNITWQNIMSGNGITGNTTRTSIIGAGSNIYIATGSLLMKLPDDGNIIGNGTYTFSPGGNTVTYATSALTQTNFTLLTVAKTIADGTGVDANLTVKSLTSNIASTNSNRAPIV